MKSFILSVFFLSLFSCEKEAVQTVPVEKEIVTVPYDTTAVDSFSVGATSVDVARRIKISSLKYQDSLKKTALKLEEEKLLNKAKEEKEKAEKKLAEEKKKLDAEKAKKQKQNPPTENQSSEAPNQP
ncbi:hypothetical protein [Kaistella sp.]|uniref:hypothetical protein n=1 Tax=Kaistella sp. TaxID=2782235 RepID=UPI002F924C77